MFKAVRFTDRMIKKHCFDPTSDEIVNSNIASPHPNHVLDLFEGMFSGNCPAPRVGEANVKDRGRGSIARK